MEARDWGPYSNPRLRYTPQFLSLSRLRRNTADDRPGSRDDCVVMTAPDKLNEQRRSALTAALPSTRS